MRLLEGFAITFFVLAPVFAVLALVTETWAIMAPAFAALIAGAIFWALDRIVALLVRIERTLSGTAVTDDDQATLALPTSATSPRNEPMSAPLTAAEQARNIADLEQSLAAFKARHSDKKA